MFVREELKAKEVAILTGMKNKEDFYGSALDSRLISSLTYVHVTTRRNRSMTSRSLSYICKTTLVVVGP